MYNVQKNIADTCLSFLIRLSFGACSILFAVPLSAMQSNNQEVFEKKTQSKLFITAKINASNNNDFSFVRSRKNKKKSSVNKVQEKLINPPVKNKYPKVFEAYTNFRMKDLDHVIERHYDPYGKKMDHGDCHKIFNKPYAGYAGGVNNQFTTFFPRNWKRVMIYKCIEDVLIDPYRVTPSSKFENALMVKGRFKDGVTTAVIVAQRPKWRVVTAYPKFQK